MALQGNLCDFSFLHLLNLVNLAKKSGALLIEKSDQQVTLYFREGKLSFVMPGTEPMSIIRVMSKAKLIPNSQAASLAAKYQHLNAKEIGIQLINSGFLTQDQIFGGIASFCREVVLSLFTWKEGQFIFEVSGMPPENCITIRLDLENLLIEGSRLMREMEDLNGEIPNLDMTLKFTERPGINIRSINLNAEEWRVVSYVNPRNSIKQIAAAAKLNEIQIRRVIYSLLQAGLVELVRPVNPGYLSMSRGLSQANLAEQKSLVNRVIDRIKAI